MVRELVKITMIKTDTGAPEGHTVFTYEKGKTYVVPLDLARAFVSDRKTAQYVTDTVSEKHTSQKR